MAADCKIDRIGYSVSEACQVTSLGRSKIYGLIADGSLEVRKIGKRTVIVADSLWRLFGLPHSVARPDWRLATYVMQNSKARRLAQHFGGGL